MKFASIVASALVATSALAAAGETYSVQDVIARAPDELPGKLVALTLSPKKGTIYYDVKDGVGILATCTNWSTFNGGRTTATIKAFTLRADTGSDRADVLELEGCTAN